MTDDMNKAAESMKERVLGRIERGEINMRSRVFLALQGIALALVLLIALAISVFLFNFIFFFIRINFVEGDFGLFDLVVFFPWTLLAIDVGLLVLAEVLWRQFQFAYRRPVILTIFILIAFALAVGVMIDRSHVNELLERRARVGHLPPPIGELYRHARHGAIPLP